MSTIVKLLEQWLALGIYRGGVKLSEGGNEVHLMYWNEKPLIEKLGSGSIDAVNALLGNVKAAELYGSVLDEDLSEVLQTLLYKFINGESLELYSNEISGIDEFDWKPFPEALIVSDGKVYCERIEEKLTDIEELLDYMVNGNRK